MFRNKFSFPGVPLRRTGVHSCKLPVRYAARRLWGAFCGQFVYWCFRFRLWSRPERTHTSYLLIIYLRRIFKCSIISIPCNISHDIGIEISRTSSRCWYRYIPNISHGTSRILDTLPNTTSKEFRTGTQVFPLVGYIQLILRLSYL